jgi:phosphate transport system permease protein
MTIVHSPRPSKPWRPTPKEAAGSALVLIGATLSSVVTVKATPLKGILAYVGLFVIFSIFGNILLGVSRRGFRTISDSAATVLMYFATSLVLLPVVSVLITVITRGAKALKVNVFTQNMAMAQPDGPYNQGGALHAILGTIVLVLLASLISVPIGILTGLYLTEIKGRAERLIRFLVQAMSGVPSIVAGLFIYSVWIVGSSGGFSGVSGAASLSILMLPTVARTAEEVLKLIPPDLREAGVALGGTQWRTVAMVVLPAARSGLITATVLGIARVAGETAPLLLTIFGTTTTNLNPFNGPMAALPLYVFQLLRTGLNVAIDRAWTGALVLLILVTILFALARFVGGRQNK